MRWVHWLDVQAAVWYLWNNYLISPLSRRPDLQQFCLPIIHGFVGTRQCFVQGRSFKLILISRRPIERWAGSAGG